MEEPGPTTPLVDAEQFLRVSAVLRDAFARLADADLDPSVRDRWQRRLLAITTLAKRDLTRAEEQLDRFSADLEASGIA